LRYFVELSYNGKKYHGWQRQPDVNTVQEVIENALSLLIGEEISVIGCGRTDTGVHASQYFLHFDVYKDLDKKLLIYKLNAFLPNDIAVYQMYLVSDRDHARFDAISRSYEYRISLKRDPFLTDTTWQVQDYNFDIQKMNDASKVLYEYQNFKCFSKSNTDVNSYDCTVSKAEWKLEGTLLIFHITANRFLRNMVRAIVGTLLNIGRDRINIDDLRKIIESKDRSRAGASVKAHGLFLTKVIYPEEIL